jgi:cysteinyl-tRNA synthetase
VDQAVRLIQNLLESGYAYRHGRDVFYDPLKFKGFGRLYGLDMSRWPAKKVRFRKDTYPGQRWNLGDFILWHGRRDPADPFYWKTAIGEGRPSWNVQDPAMITQHLGYQIDISCGGVDNLYRHHDYNIAVIEGVSGKPLAAYWLHGEHVLVEGVKMSKSRGNIVYLSDLLGRGYRPHHLRFYLIYGHYREKAHLDENRLHLARGKVDTLRDILSRLADPGQGPAKSDPAARKRIESLRSDFENYMNDDLDVRGAFDAVYDSAAALAAMQARGALSRSDAGRAADILRRIDSVWRITGSS